VPAAFIELASDPVRDPRSNPCPRHGRPSHPQ
jgi:hypothetical protein